MVVDSNYLKSLFICTYNLSVETCLTSTYNFILQIQLEIKDKNKLWKYGNNFIADFQFFILTSFWQKDIWFAVELLPIIILYFIYYYSSYILNGLCYIILYYFIVYDAFFKAFNYIYIYKCTHQIHLKIVLCKCCNLYLSITNVEPFISIICILSWLIVDNIKLKPIICFDKK